MPRSFKMFLAVVFALGTVMAVTPAPAHAGKRCNFSRGEKIAMVSWWFPVAGAVITGLACKRDLF